jgi:acetyl-CoA carboxylase biotin carboxyl carrier protein
MSLSYKEVAEILKIIDASSMDEVVLELDDARLVVRRGAAAESSAISTPDVKSIPATTQIKTKVKQAPNTFTWVEPDIDDNCTVLRSPMVGIFYARPSPKEAPFVSEGSQITAGNSLCLIEVMKLYNTIEATADGVIESILVEDGKPVEFDQPLFVIRNHD